MEEKEMTKEEFDEMVNELKEQGASDNDIAGAFLLMFLNDQITSEMLFELLDGIGFILNDEFRNLSDEDKKSEIISLCGGEDRL